MNAVLAWAKANIFIVIFCAIMIIVPVLMWFVAGGINDDVRAEVAKRASLVQDMDRHRKVVVSIVNPVPGNPPISESLVLNPSLLDRYRFTTEIIRGDAERIREEAVQFNRKQRGVLLPDLLPAPPEYRRETLPLEMHRTLRAAYQQLLDDVQAGSPPSAEEVRDNIEAARERFIVQILVAEDMTSEDEAWLAKQLANTRLSRYADAAAAIGLYASLGGLRIPDVGSVPPRAEGQGLVELFEWQWQYWIIQDILLALHEANKDSSSVLDAPAKRLVSIDLLAGTRRRVASPPPKTRGRGRRGAGGSSADAGSAETNAPAVNAVKEVARDFAVSFTGRGTNSLYDVRWVSLVIVVDTARMPDVFDALAQRNFITITKAAIQPVDPFSALKSGYFYGTAPASQVTLELETIWFRQWTAQFMPDELKTVLGITVPTSPPVG